MNVHEYETTEIPIDCLVFNNLAICGKKANDVITPAIQPINSTQPIINYLKLNFDSIKSNIIGSFNPIVSSNASRI